VIAVLAIACVSVLKTLGILDVAEAVNLDVMLSLYLSEDGEALGQGTLEGGSGKTNGSDESAS